MLLLFCYCREFWCLCDAKELCSNSSSKVSTKWQIFGNNRMGRFDYLGI